MLLRSLLLGSTGFPFIARSPTDEGGGGGGGGDTPQLHRPEGLSDELAGSTDQETIDKLYGAFKSATTPGAAEDYVVAWDGDHKDALTAAFGNADDPLYSSARESAVKHGIPAKAFAGLMTDVFGPALASGVLPAPFNPAREIETWGQSIGVTDKAALTRELTERQTFASGLGKQLGLSDGGQTALDVLTDTADGLEVIDKLRGMLSADGIKIDPGSVPAGAGLSKEDLHKLDSDERIDPASPKFDPALRKKYDAAYVKHYG